MCIRDREGWCHRAEDTRLFRLDRIETAEVLDADGTAPAAATARDLDAGTFVPRRSSFWIIDAMLIWCLPRISATRASTPGLSSSDSRR